MSIQREIRAFFPKRPQINWSAPSRKGTGLRGFSIKKGSRSAPKTTTRPSTLQKKIGAFVKQQPFPLTALKKAPSTKLSDQSAVHPEGQNETMDQANLDTGEKTPLKSAPALPPVPPSPEQTKIAFEELKATHGELLAKLEAPNAPLPRPEELPALTLKIEKLIDDLNDFQDTHRKNMHNPELKDVQGAFSTLHALPAHRGLEYLKAQHLDLFEKLESPNARLTPEELNKLKGIFSDFKDSFPLPLRHEVSKTFFDLEGQLTLKEAEHAFRDLKAQNKDLLKTLKDPKQNVTPEALAAFQRTLDAFKGAHRLPPSSGLRTEVLALTDEVLVRQAEHAFQAFKTDYATLLQQFKTRPTPPFSRQDLATLWRGLEKTDACLAQKSQNTGEKSAVEKKLNAFKNTLQSSATALFIAEHAALKAVAEGQTLRGTQQDRGAMNQVHIGTLGVEGKEIGVVVKPKQTKRTNALVDKKMGILEHSPLYAQRNAATSKMAYLLGWPDRAVVSVTVEQIAIEGAPIPLRDAIVMEKAPGQAGGRFFQAVSEAKRRHMPTLEQLRDSPELRKQFTQLHILDILTGQGDRHFGNYFIKRNEGGGFTVTGIDNDGSFGANTKKADDLANARTFTRTKENKPLFKGLTKPQTQKAEEILKKASFSLEAFTDLLSKKTKEEVSQEHDLNTLVSILKSNLSSPDAMTDDAIKQMIKNLPEKTNPVSYFSLHLGLKAKIDIQDKLAIASLSREIKAKTQEYDGKKNTLTNQLENVYASLSDPNDRKTLEAIAKNLTEQYQETASRMASHGIFLPTVISWSQYSAVMAMGEGHIRAITEGLSAAEVDATRSRLKGLQKHFQVLARQPGGVIFDDQWGSADVGRRMFPSSRANNAKNPQETGNLIETSYLQSILGVLGVNSFEKSL